MMLYALEATVRGDHLLVVIVYGFQLLSFIGSVVLAVFSGYVHHNITPEHISGELTSSLYEDFQAVQARWTFIHVHAFDTFLFYIFSQRLHGGEVYR